MSANPVVYFIDDSATMREVIKIAFRRENINVVACHDAATAMGMMDENVPDVVISDVIMPDKDGYEVCQYIKQHPKLGKTPVILMSGVVNKQVAEKAFAVKADELIRKPFQPQDPHYSGKTPAESESRTGRSASSATSGRSSPEQHFCNCGRRKTCRPASGDAANGRTGSASCNPYSRTGSGCSASSSSSHPSPGCNFSRKFRSDVACAAPAGTRTDIQDAFNHAAYVAG